MFMKPNFRMVEPIFYQYLNKQFADKESCAIVFFKNLGCFFYTIIIWNIQLEFAIEISSDA